jgi:hypothetical protein
MNQNVDTIFGDYVDDEKTPLGTPAHARDFLGDIVKTPRVGDAVQYFHAADRPPLAALVTAAGGTMVQLAVFWPGAAAFVPQKGVEYSAEPKSGCWRWPA